MIIWSGKLHLLYKGNATFKITEFHLEERVELCNLSAAWLKFSYEFNTFKLVYVERSGNRTIATQTGRIDVPSRLDFSAKHDFGHSTSVCFQRAGELYRVHHLRLSQHYYKE